MLKTLGSDPKGHTMKRKLLSTLLLFTLVLAACGVSDSGTPTAPTQVDDLPIETRIAVGTLKLEGGEQAVSAEQAGELLVMWQVYQELRNSDTAAQAEIDGLVQQIQDTLTPEQMEAIQVMSLTQQDVFALMQEQGAEMGLAQRSSSEGTFTFDPAAGGGPPDGGGGPPPDGGMGGGAPPDGGMGGDMGEMGGVAPGSGTDQSQGAATGQDLRRNEGVPTAVVSALIQYLEGKAGQ